MIERVDILTGGASAVYGSDAISGVVNFIMKKDFEGVQVTSQYSFYWHENDFGGPGGIKLRDTIEGLAESNPSQFALPDDSVTDGEGKELSLMVGVNSGDGRGNITAYATVYDAKQVLQRDRDYSACSLNPNPVGSFGCGGSSTSAGGLFTDSQLLPHGGYRRFVPPRTCSAIRRAPPVQLRPAELLSASGAPLQHWRDGSLRVRRARRRLHAAHVQRLRVGRPDRCRWATSSTR